MSHTVTATAPSVKLGELPPIPIHWNLTRDSHIGFASSHESNASQMLAQAVGALRQSGVEVIEIRPDNFDDIGPELDAIRGELNQRRDQRHEEGLVRSPAAPIVVAVDAAAHVELSRHPAVAELLSKIAKAGRADRVFLAMTVPASRSDLDGLTRAMLNVIDLDAVRPDQS